MTATDAPVLRRIVCLAFGLTLLQYLLPPNGFSVTVLLFDYDFGLIRRGLVGAVANFYWGDTVSRAEALTVSAIMSLFGLVSLLAYCLIRAARQAEALIWVLLLVTSFAFAAMVGATGYMDMVLIGLVSLALLSDGARITGVVLRGGAAVLGVLSHEVMLAYFCVFLAVDIWLARAGAGVLTRLSLALVPLLAGLLAFGLVATKGQIAPDDLPAFKSYIAQKAEFSVTVTAGDDLNTTHDIDPEAVAIVDRSITDNLSVMADKRAEAGYKAWVIFDGLPLAAMMIWLMLINLRLRVGAHWFDQLLILGAILAPQSLNIIAFDVVRFGAVSCLVGFLLVLSQLRASPNSRDLLRDQLSWPVVLGVLVINQYFAVTQLSIGSAHRQSVPWVLLEQLNWL